MTDVKNEITAEVEKKSLIDEIKTQPVIAPLTDIFETTDDYYLQLSIPGVSKENIAIKMEENTLTIICKVNLEEILDRKYLLRETPIGNYYRRFKVSDSIDADKIDAKLENGLLLIKLPKLENVKPRDIVIQ